MNYTINHTHYTPEFTRKILRACHTAMNNTGKISLIKNRKGVNICLVRYHETTGTFDVLDMQGETMRYSMGKALIMNAPLLDFKQGVSSFIQLHIAG